MKATPEEYDFHQRICARDDPIAFSQLADLLYAPLVFDVRKRAGGSADAALIEEAVGQALLDYNDQPDRYDPNLKSLQGYLAMAAYRDFQNAQAREHRILNRQISLFDPALRAGDIADDAPELDALADAEDLWSMIDTLFPDATDRRIVDLIINRERSIEPYAAILDMSHLPDDERRKQVQLVKYRLARKLRRNIGRKLSPGEGELS